MMPSLHQIARMLGGEVAAGQVVAPGPGHRPADRSLSVKLNAAGDDVVVHSFAGDDPIACKDFVRDKLGLAAWQPRKGNGRANGRSMDDEIDAALAGPAPAAAAAKPISAAPVPEKLVCSYDYTDLNHELLYQVRRYEPKTFKQRRPDGKGGWITQKVFEGVSRVPYRYPELMAEMAAYPDAPIFITEGEKDCDNVRALGLFATCVAGSVWTPEIAAVLKGRDIIYLADNDKVGREKADKAGRALHGVAKSVRIASFTDLPEKGDVSDWIALDPGHDADALGARCLDAPLFDPKPAAEAPFEVFWHGVNYGRIERPWLVKEMIPEQGTGLLSGQWGTGKSFVALDLAGSVMTSPDFAGRRIDRRGGVLLIAAEGAGEVSIRLNNMVDHKLKPNALEKLPFAWIEDVPDLKDEDSYKRLVTVALSIAAKIKADFDAELVLIIIDTLAAAASFKDANDAAEGQLVMNRLVDLGRKTGAYVLAVDHFGKDATTGTRGTSAKEAAADSILAILADRDVNGKLSNTRMAIRKVRGGKTGVEFSFDLVVVDAGFDQTTCTVDWKAERVEGGETGAKIKWPKSLRIFRTSMQTVILDHAKTIHPYGAQGPKVQAVTIEQVRTEFMAAYPTDSSDSERDQKAAKRAAFNRGLKEARAMELIGSREIGGVDLLWFAQIDTANGAN
jgi:AAA domain